MSNSSSIPRDDFGIYLVFCNKNVDPDTITVILEIEPTEAVKLGEVSRYSWNNQEYISKTGLWKLEFRSEDQNSTPESVISSVIATLQGKEKALAKLRDAGYKPYLSCCAGNTLDFYFDDAAMQFLGQNGIGLSVYFSQEYTAEGFNFEDRYPYQSTE